MRYFSKSGLDLFYGRKDSAGIDLPFYDEELSEVVLQPGERRLIKTGMYVEIPTGYVGLLDTRSSAGKVGVDLLCRTIDADYRGDIRLMVINTGNEPLTIERGIYVAQMLILKLGEDRVLTKVPSVEELSETDRGDGGFGSTGLNLQ